MADLSEGIEGKVLVVIPTTAGPVRVVSLRTIGSTGRSAVLLDGTTTQANISNSYNDFVKSPTGLINRLFDSPDTPTYRLDISDRIEAGSSWNLAVLAAHALKAAARETAPTVRQAGHLVWASGSINAVHLSVERVAHISEKLRNSRELFETALAAGLAVHVFLPAGTELDVDDDVAGMLAALGIAPLFAGRVDDLLAKLGLPALPRAATDEPSKAGGWKGNPYRGLEPYLQEHRAIFFGRAKAREEAAELLRVAEARGRPFLLVHGPSGVGKSSFVRAGVAGDLEARLGAEGGLRVTALTPSGGTSPSDAVRAALAALGAEPAGAAAQPRAAGGRPQRLLIVDQLEELFAASVGQAERTAFCELLEKEVRGGSTCVVATIRSDALGALDEVPALARLARGERLYRLERPSRREFSEIIASPAALAGHTFPDAAVPDELVEQAMASSDSLPLLQAVLYRLFERSEGKGRLTAQDLSRLGGFEGVVGRWADEVAEDLVAGGVGEADLDRLLVSLVRVDRDTERPHARTLAYDPASAEGGILLRLAESRLVGLSGGTAGPQARLAHEVLIAHWERLAGLVRRLTAAMTLRDDLEARACRWLVQGRDEAELLRNASQLEAAVQLGSDSLVVLGDHEREYVAVSLALRRGQARKKLASRALALGAVVALAALSVAFFFQESERRRQNAEAQVGRLELERVNQRNAIVQAFADAKTAEERLGKGDSEGAAELARKALFASNTGEFIPRAYNALYHSKYLPPAPDLPFQSLRPDIPSRQLNDGSFATTTYGQLVIWAPGRGVLFTRDIAGGDPQVAPDGSAVFIKGTLTLSRYTTKSRRWTELNIAIGMFGDESLKTFAPVDAHNIVGCSEEGSLYRIETNDNGASKVSQRAELSGVECMDIYSSEGGRVFVRDTNGVAEYDQATLSKVAHYNVKGYPLNPPQTRMGIIAIEASGPKIAFFRRGESESFIEFDEDVHISPTGRYVSHSEWRDLTEPNREGLRRELKTSIIDISGKGEGWEYSCSCRVAGFDEADRLVYFRDKSIYVYDSKNKSEIVVQSFADDIESVALTERGSGALVVAGMGKSRYIKLRPSQTDVVRVTAPGDGLIRGLALSGASRVVMARSPARKDHLASERLQMTAFDRKGDAYGAVWNFGTDLPDYTKLHKLSDETFVLSRDPTSSGDNLFVVRIGVGIVKKTDNVDKFNIDEPSKRLVYERGERLKYITADDPTDRDVGGLESPVRSWAAKGAIVIAASDQTLTRVDLNANDKPRAVDTNRSISHVCASQNYVWTLESADEADAASLYTLWRRDLLLGDARRLADVKDIEPSDDAAEDDPAGPEKVLQTYATKSFICSDAGAYWAEKEADPEAIYVDGDAASTPPGGSRRLTASSRGDYLDVSEDTKIKLFHQGADRPSAEMYAGNSAASAALYDPVRNVVIVGFENGAIKAWDLSKHTEPFLELSSGLSKIERLALSGDGSRLAASGWRGGSFVWPLPTAKQLLEASR